MLAKREANLAPRAVGDLSPQSGGGTASRSHGTGVIRSLWRRLWRRRGTIVVLTAFALLPAILYLKLVTPLYTSTSDLLICRTAGSDHAPRLDGGDSLSAGELAAQVVLQRDVITSTPVLAAALATPGVRDCSPLRDHHDLIQTLKRSLQIETGEGGLISLSIASSDPDEGTCILGSVVQAYSQFLSSLRRNGNLSAFTALQSERNRDQSELSKDAADLLRFGKEHHVGGGGDLAATGAAELARLSEVAGQAHVEAVQAKEASDELDRALATNPQRAQRLKWFEQSAPASDQAGSDDEELIRRELLALKVKQAELEPKLLPGHPSLTRIQERIDQLNLEYDASIQRRAIAAKQREVDMQNACNQEQQHVLDSTSQQAEFVRRSQGVANLQKAIDDLNQRIASLDLADNSGTPTVTVLNPAKASLQPTSPRRQRVLLLAAIVGLSFSGLVACWLERGHTGTARQPISGLGLPVVAELPRLPTDFGPIGRGQQVLADGGPVMDDIFRGVRAIVDGAKMRARGAIVLITSASRGDGKSVLAANLAVALAQSRKRVLLIDANLRSPALGKMFGLGNATGLTTLLEAEVSIPITAIHHTATSSLDVIPCGPEVRNPSDLFNSERLIDLLGDLSERYDYLLIDSPPTVTFTDARIISASCDITIMVVRSDQLNRRVFDLAREGLTAVGANLCGAIMNSGMDQQRSEQILGRTGQDAEGPETPVNRYFESATVATAIAADAARGQATNQQSSSTPSLPDASDRQAKKDVRFNGKRSGGPRKQAEGESTTRHA